MFRYRLCRRTFNERTGTPINHLQVPTDVALLVVLWRLRYKLSLRDRAEMFLLRGFSFTRVQFHARGRAGLGRAFGSAARFCSTHDELYDYLRYRQHLNETVSLAEQRRLFHERWGEVVMLQQAA